jgi:hypothetical protein
MIRAQRHDSLRPALVITASLALAFLGLGPLPAGAQSSPTIGSPNTVTAAPGVPRPPTTPCAVALFTNQQFADFNPKVFDYTPPADCPGPWAKVVLEVDLSIDAGNQFDRTAQIALGGVNIYFGTTAEPYSNFGPSWHVERDLTDYSALFTTPQSGNANLGNLVNSTFTSVLTGTATLQFYPPSAAAPAPRTPDLVLPLPANTPPGSTAFVPGGVTLLASGSDVLEQTFNLPANVESAYLDVIAQSQNDDEFWYTCVPDTDSKLLESCGGTAFRETEVTLDGRAAGVAPVRPWIFTGGLDPELWAPLPGVQTLDFEPFRVDLTPFAGVLSNGSPHKVGISVFNANNYFQVSGTLLLFLDSGSAQVTGAVTRNTLSSAPVPHITQSIAQKSDGSVSALVATSEERSFTISGFVNTSHGRVQTTLDQLVTFSNRQVFSLTASAFVQDITQGTEVSTQTRTQDGSSATVAARHFVYPLTVDIGVAFNSDGSGSQTTSISQTFENDGSHIGGGTRPLFDSTTDTEKTSDTLLFNAAGQITGFQGRSSTQSFFEESTSGLCFSRQLASSAGLLTSIADGKGCTGGVNSF